MKHVLFFGNLFPLPWESGRGLFNWRQARELAKNCRVTALVPVPWQTYWRQSSQERDTYERDGIRIIPFCYWYIPGMLRATYALSLFLSLWLAWPRWRGIKADTVLASWLYPDAVAAGWLSRLLGLPLVMKAHGTDVNEQCRHSLRRAQVRSAARHARAVYTVSEELAQQLRDMDVGKDRLAVIYNGIEHDCFREGDRHAARQELGLIHQGRTVLYVGNLKAEKGVLLLPEALAQVPVETCARLVFVGDGTARRALNEKVMALGLSDRVIMAGWQPPERVHLWMVAADALVLPSFSEGVPNVVLEAMASGLPVLATRVGGIPEVLPESAGLLFEARSVPALASALNELAQREFDCDAIRHYTRRFSWPDNVASVSKLLFDDPGERL